MASLILETYYENFLYHFVGHRPDPGVYADDGDKNWDPFKDRYLGPATHVFPKPLVARFLKSLTPARDIPLKEALQHELNAQVFEVKQLAEKGLVGRMKKGRIVAPFSLFADRLDTVHRSYETLIRRIPDLLFPWDVEDEASACKKVIEQLKHDVTELQSSRNKDDQLYVQMARAAIESLKARLKLLKRPLEEPSPAPVVR